MSDAAGVVRAKSTKVLLVAAGRLLEPSTLKWVSGRQKAAS